MSSTKMSGFYKNEDCPTSHDLQAFQSGEPDLANGREIRRHLTRCEFCSAEFEFYSHYPQADPSTEHAEPAAIPAPLFQLAEALLKNRHDATSLNSLLKEREQIVLDNA